MTNEDFDLNEILAPKKNTQQEILEKLEEISKQNEKISQQNEKISQQNEEKIGLLKKLVKEKNKDKLKLDLDL